jgi:YfiH family protein
MKSHVDVITEDLATSPAPLLVHGGWAERWPWLVQGTTTRGQADPWDMALFGGGVAREVQERWDALLGGMPALGAVHARQVHGPGVRYHRHAHAGFRVTPPCDGHVTAAPGLLLAVSVADCVPVFMVAPEPRAVAVVHAGWRGAAAGVLESAVAAFRDRLGIRADGLHMHLGPSICGDCYEVGPEVFRALGEPEPSGPRPLDLRRNLEARAVAAGIAVRSVTRSGHCTLCGDASLFSHRGGDAGRQMGLIGVAVGP